MWLYVGISLYLAIWLEFMEKNTQYSFSVTSLLEELLSLSKNKTLLSRHLDLLPDVLMAPSETSINKYF